MEEEKNIRTCLTTIFNQMMESELKLEVSGSGNETGIRVMLSIYKIHSLSFV